MGMELGAKSATACPSCGAEVAPAAKFCSNCGAALAQPPSPPATPPQSGPAAEGERRPVTILFTDIVGSTAISERLDPEEWRKVVSGAHRRVSDAIIRYEGTIAQLLGDGVLAFFGAPVAHEDDPARAVHAALDIHAGRRLVAEQALAVPHAYGKAPELHQPSVRGAQLDEMGHLRLKDVVVEKHAGA